MILLVKFYYRFGLIFSYNTQTRKDESEYYVFFQWEIAPFTLTETQYYNEDSFLSFIDILRYWIMDETYKLTTKESQKQNFLDEVIDEERWLWGVQIFEKKKRTRNHNPKVLFRIIDTYNDRMWIKDYGTQSLSDMLDKGKQVMGGYE